MLTESELQQIRDEAKKKYPLPTVQYMVSTHSVVISERKVYIAIESGLAIDKTKLPSNE